MKKLLILSLLAVSFGAFADVDSDARRRVENEAKAKEVCSLPDNKLVYDQNDDKQFSACVNKVYKLLEEIPQKKQMKKQS